MTDKELVKKIKLLKNIEPDQEWLKSERAYILQEIAAQSVQEEKVEAKFALAGFFQFLKPRMVEATVLSLTLVLAVFSITAVAAQDALPGDSLYSAKIVTEKVLLTLKSGGQRDITELETSLANRRLEEFSQLAQQQNTVEEEKITEAAQSIKNQISAVQNQLDKVKKESSRDVKIIAQVVKERTKDFEDTLTKANEQLSPEIQEKVKQDVDEALNSAAAVRMMTEEELAEQEQLKELEREEIEIPDKATNTIEILP